MPMEKGSGEAILAYIKKQPGVKPEEIKWMGLDEFLKNKKSVTKQEVLDYISSNKLEIDEVTRIDRRGDTGGGEYEGGEVFENFELTPINDSALLSEEIGVLTENVWDSLLDDLEYFSSVVHGLQQAGKITRGDEEFLLNAFKEGKDMYSIIRGDDTLHKSFEGRVWEEAEFQYKENPYLEWENEYGYSVIGNDEHGYTIKDPQGNTIPGEIAYSEEEVRIVLQDDMINSGLLSEGSEDAARWLDYQMPGPKTNEREFIVRLPGITKTKSDGTRGDMFVETAHYPETNPIFHVRVNERIGPNGEKIFFIEEIQSDWHTAGRKHGYKLSKEDFDLAFTRVDEIRTEQDRIRRGVDPNEAPTKETLAKLDALVKEEQKLLDSMGATIPDAPLKKSWYETALRRMARMAAEEGYTHIAWTPGREQAKRWKQLRKIEKINVEKIGGDGAGDWSIIKGLYKLTDEMEKEYLGKTSSLRKLSLADMVPAHHGSAVSRDRLLTALIVDLDTGLIKGGSGLTFKTALVNKNLADVVGKEAADKVLNMNRAADSHSFDVNFEVGGEGKIDLYDKMFKNYAEKWGKKFGAKVKTVKINTYDELVNISPEDIRKSKNISDINWWANLTEGQRSLEIQAYKKRTAETEVWSLELTPEMKKEVLEKGVPFTKVIPTEQSSTSLA